MIREKTISGSGHGGYNVSAEARELATLDYCYHAATAGLSAELKIVLFDFDYVRRKVSKAGPEALTADIEYALCLTGNDVAHSGDYKQALLLLRDAINLSAEVIASDCAQLASQLLARLLECRIPEFAPLLEKASVWQGVPWLRPKTASLLRPGTPLVRIISVDSVDESWPKALAMRSDNSEVFAVCSDGTLRIWNLFSGSLVGEIRTGLEASGAVNVAVHDAGLVAAFADGMVFSRSFGDGRHQTTLCPEGTLPPVITPDGRVIVVAQNRTLRVCDGKTGGQIRTVCLHSGRISALAALCDCKHIVSASEDGRIMIWDVDTGHNLVSLEGHRDRVTVLQRGFNENELISAGDDQAVRLWDIANHRECCSLISPHPVVAMGVSREARRVVMVSSEGFLGLWNVKSLKDDWTDSGHGHPALAVSSDGRWAVTTAIRSLRLWNLDKIQTIAAQNEDSPRFLKLLTKPKQTHRQHMNIRRIETVAIDNGGDVALTGSFDGEINRWSVIRGKKRDFMLERRLAIKHAAMGVSDLLAIRGCSGIAGVSACGGWLLAWDFEGIERISWRAHSDVIDALALSGSDLVVSAGRNGEIKVWDLNNLTPPRPVKMFRHHLIPFLEKSALADFFIRRQQLTIRTADLLLSGQELRRSEGTYAEDSRFASKIPAYAKEMFIESYGKVFGGVVRLGISQDGRIAASSSYATIKVWNIDQGRIIQTIRSADGFLAALAVVPDGSLVLGAVEHEVGIFDVATGRKVKSFKGHLRPVYDVDVTPDGKRAISVSQDRTLRVWDMSSTDLIATFSADAALYCCRVAPDSTNIVAGDGMGSVHFLTIQ